MMMYSTNRLLNTATRFIQARSFATSTTTRPFTILGVQQIAIGCESRGPLRALWQDIFGLQPADSVTLAQENVQEDVLQLGPKPFQVEIDLMTPIDANKSPKVCLTA
jgi:lactoylglutathione lyase